MLKAIFLTILFSVTGFIAFLFLGVLVAGEIWPDSSYEKALPYLLSIGVLGAAITTLGGRKIFKSKH